MGFYVGGKHADSIEKLLEAIQNYITAETGVKLDKVYVIYLALKKLAYDVPNNRRRLVELTYEVLKEKEHDKEKFRESVERVISILRERISEGSL